MSGTAEYQSINASMRGANADMQRAFRYARIVRVIARRTCFSRFNFAGIAMYGIPQGRCPNAIGE
jgi:hypothetical protein